MGTYTNTNSGETLTGTVGDDVYVYNINTWGIDSISDGGGSDTVDFTGVTNAITVNLATGVTEDAKIGAGDYIQWDDGVIENIVGGSGADVIYGSTGNNTLTGGGGADTLVGGSGDDTYVFTDGSGLDSISDSGGTDTFDFSARTDNIKIALDSTEFITNTYITDAQSKPSVTSLSDGGFVVTWQSSGQDGDGTGIYGQRYDSNGAASGGEFQINTYTTYSQGNSSVTSLSDGGFVVTWSGGGSGDSSGIYGQRYDSNGATVGSEFQINTYTTSSQIDPSVTGLTDGGFVVTWESWAQDGEYEGVYGQRYDSNGSASGTEFQINTYTTDSQLEPSVTGLTDGGFVVTWKSYTPDGDEYGVYGQQYDSNGATVGSEFQINTYTTTDQQGSSVTSLSDGGFVVTWLSNGQDGDNYGIYGQRYDSNGTASGAEFQISTYTTNNQDDPSVTSLSDGGFVVTWSSNGQDGDVNGIYGQRYDSNGAASGGEFQISTYTTSSQFDSSVTGLSDGGFVVTWQSSGQDGSGYGIYSQRYDSNGNAIGNLLNYTPNTIEYVIGGSGDDHIVGSSAANSLTGGAGNDTLMGRTGNDTLVGGTGDDVYEVDSASDVVTENASEGTDSVFSSVTYTLSSNVENLTLTGSSAINGTGNTLDNVITGNSGNNSLTGGDGNDTIDGGLGNDTMVGGLGDDTFVVNSSSDVVTESASQGTDLVQSSATFTLGNNVENLTLTGSANINGTGNTLNNVIIGNTGNNSLSGSSGNDTIDGGAGSDTLVGGTGNDTLIVDNVGDVVTENASEGTDTVEASITYTLGSNVENLTLTGSANIDGTGNTLNNVMTGNSGNNLLDGGDGNDTLTGGAGNDTLVGGLGNDRYVFTDDSDMATINDSGGTDTFDFSARTDNLYIALDSTEFRTNTYATSDQSYPSVTSLLDGGFVITWYSTGQDGSAWGVYGQRYDSNGAASGSEFQINTYTTNTQYQPSVTGLSDGGFVVTWDGSGTGDTGGVYGQRYDSNGATVGSEFQINTYTTSYQYRSSVTGLSDGGFVVTWESTGQDGDEEGIYGQRYDSNGATSGGEFQISTYTTGYQIKSSVTSLSDGGFVVTWSSDGQDGDSEGVYGQRYDSNGATVGSEFQINTYTTSFQGGSSVTSLSDGGFVVTWGSGGQDGNSTGIYGQRYDSNGATIGSEFQINTYTTGSQSTPSVTSLSDGGFVVTWDSSGQDGNSTGLFGQRYDSNGTASGAEFQINVYTSGQQTSAEVTGLLDGGFVVTWMSAQGGFSNWDIYTHRYDSNGNVVGNPLTYTANTIEYVIGGSGNDYIVGSSVANSLTGGTGNDTLIGRAGNDTLVGGTGDDVYEVDSTSDVVTENALEGTDTVYSSVTYTLGNNVENLTLTGSTINGTGNLLDNVITGSGWNNSITGGGGNDTMLGEAGNDTYVFAAGSGQDSVSDSSGTDTFTFSTRTDNLNIDLSAGTATGGATTEFRVNTYTAGNQYNPSVTSLSDGGFVVTWDSSLQDGDGEGLYGQRYDSNGSVSGSEFQINTYTTYNQGSSSVTGLSDGGFVVTWTSSDGQDGSAYGVYGQRYDSNGAAAGGEFQINTYTDNSQSSLSVTSLSDGGFVVTWYSYGQDGDGNGIYGQRYDSNGSVSGGEFLINTYTTDYQSSPSVTSLSDGGFVVTWDSTGQDGSAYGIYGQRYDSNGATVGSEFQINTYTTNSQFASEVTGLSDGGFVITWHSSLQDGSTLGIYGQRYDSNGSVLGAEFQINTYTTNDQNSSSVTGLSDGGFVVTWSSNGQDGSGYGIYGQRYDSDGDAAGAEFRINTYTTSNQFNSSVTSLSDGGFVVTWQSYGPDGDSYGIYGQRYDSNGNPVGIIVTYDANTIENVIGGSGNDSIIGSSAANSLTGGAGNDTLDGGTGNDTLVGGTGDDLFIVDSTSDVVTESASQGTDTVQSSATFTLGTNVENLTLTGSDNINGTGNASNNVIIGNSGDNSLSGGTGADTMSGGLGNDTYVVDNTGDVVTENAAEGTDLVQSSVTYTLSANVEDLTLTGTSAINGTGNDMANVITGNTGANILTGGLGNDTLIGGSGNDRYVFTDGSGLDSINDSAGTDTFDFSARTDNIKIALDSTETLINTYTASAQEKSSITSLPDGGFVVIWGSAGPDGSGYGISGQRYDSNGAASGSEFQINTYTTSSQITPSVTSLSDGGFIVTWNSQGGQDGAGDGIFGQRYDSNGAAAGSEFQINTYTTNSQSWPSVTSLLDGGFVVTWNSSGQDGNNGGNYGQRYDSNGTASGAEFQINTYTTGMQFIPSVTSLSDGGFVVTWESSGQDGAGYGIFGQRYDSNGSASGGEFQINTYTTGNQQAPSVISLSDGSFVVTWSGEGSGDSYGIYGQRYDSNGAASGSEFQINTYTTGDQSSPSVTSLSDGGFVVTWNSVGQDGDISGIYGQRYDSNGATVGSEFQINTYTTTTQFDPSVTGLSDGGFVVTWTSSGQDGSAYGVYSQRYDSNGNVVGNLLNYTPNTIEYVIGGSGDDHIAGSSVANSLTGGAGNDTLIGRAGNDTLVGGTGDDLYEVDSASDVITENASEGTDSVNSSVTYTLGANVDNLTLTGTGNINGTGNLLDNVITGNSGNNSLTGGDGNDTLIGSWGNDTYVFANGSGLDSISDNSGTDTLNFSARTDNLNIDLSAGTATGGATTEFRVSTYTTGSQANSSVTSLLDGGFVVTWGSVGTGDTDGGIYGQRYDSNGATVGGEFQINTYTTYNQDAPSVTSLSDGGFVVTWDSNGQDGNDYGIYGQRYDSNGATVGGEFQINTYTTGGQNWSQVIGLSNGGFVIAWSSSGGQDGSISGAYGQRYDSNGTPAGGEFLINTYTTDDQFIPSVTGLSDGSFVVTWNSDGQDGNSHGIYGQRYDSNGATSGGEFQINTYTTGSQTNSSVTSLSDGGFVVTWKSWAPDSSYGIYGQRYDSNGATVGSDFQINTYTTNDQVNPSVTSLSDGGFVVTWQSYLQDGSVYGIYGQRYDSNGTASGGEFQINTYTTNGQTNSSVASLSDGGFVVTWHSFGQDGSANGIYGQRYDSNGNPVGTIVTYDANTMEYVIGGSGNDNIVGSSVANSLTGGAGNDTLDGGTGIDTLVGGTGDDLYIVDSTSDVVTESASQGTDTVQSSATFTLGSNVENLTLTGSDNINGTGNTLDNVIIGNTGDNSLSGGSGSDTMLGGSGNDTYVFAAGFGVNSVSDTSGTDTFDLSARTDNLSINLSAGTATGGATTEFRVNTYTTDNQRNSSVTALSDGGFVVTWESWEQDGNWYDVYGQRYDSNGSAAGAEFQINTYTTDWQSSPSVTGLSDGGFVITWSSVDQDGDSYGIYGQRYSSNGAAAGSEFQINTYTTNAQLYPSVTSLTDGGFVVTWESSEQDGANNGIYGQRYDSNGAASGAEFQINTYTTGGQSGSSVTGLSDGGFVITWYSNGQDGSSYGVYGQRYDSNGTATGSEFQINTYTTSLQADSSVTSLTDGGFVVTWESNQDGNSYGIYGQRYDSNGAASGSEFQINTYTTNAQLYPSVTGLSDGGFVVTWESSLQDGNVEGIYGQRYDSNGAASGAEFRINTYTTGTQGVPSVTGLSDGGFVVTWESDGQDGSNYGIFGQRYDSNGNPVGSIVTYDANTIENVIGGTGNDTIVGSSAANSLTGGTGNDTLTGGLGNDTLIGGSGNDTYVFTDGSGLDSINDSAGTDTFDFSARTDNIKIALDSTETLINTYTVSSQENPSVTGLSDGGFVVTWTSNGQDGSGDGVYGQRYDSNGTAVGAEFKINTYTTDLQYSSSVTGLSGGGFVVTWRSYQDGTFTSNIYGQRYDSNGAASGAEFQINTYTTNEQASSSVTNLSDGSFVVTWKSSGQDGNSYGIYGQRYDSNGAASGAEFQINTYTTNDQAASSVTSLSDGGFVVTWHSNFQDSSNYGIYGQRYNSNGAAAGGEFLINTSTIDLQSNPSVTGLSDGGFVVTWTSNLQDGNSYGIYGQRYDSNGATSGGEFQINTYTTGSQTNSSVTGLSDGGFVVTWNSNGQDGSVNGIYGQRYDSNGATSGAEFRINTYTTGEQFDPSVTSLSDGGFVVTWESFGQDGDLYGIYTQRYDSNGNAIGNLLNYTANTIEYVIGGSGDDHIVGSSVANSLTGGAGNDTLMGRAGNDTLVGGTGDDVYDVDSASDVITENASEGTDSVFSSVTYTLGANVENLTLTGSSVINGTGNTLDNVITGNGQSNILTGGDGNDTIDGGSSGNDTMVGGTGDDVYVVNGSTDVVTENASEGTDTVQSSASTFTLSANVENLTLTGSGNINGIGNASDNVLTGNSGNNSLTGGAGNDTLDGGDGNDVYVFAASFGSDTITGAGTGRDTVNLSSFATSVTINLGTGGTGDEVTDGTNTVNWAGTLIENATGGSAADSIIGNIEANYIIGGGGNDTMDGGVGSDTYEFSGTWGADSIIDAGGTIDHVILGNHTSALTINLASGGVGDEVTDGTNTINWGAAVLMEKATGGTASDWIIGNSANNWLEGKGGNDTMEGGSGNDTYVFANTWGIDTIIDSSGTNDAISMRSVTTALTINLGTLGIGDEVTNGTYTINWASNAIEQAFSGSGSDLIYGNSAKNLLYGGAGNDTIYGYGGDDTYTFENNWGADSLIDSAGTNDTINLSSVTTAMTINLVSDAGGHEVTNGTYTINWDNSEIEKALSGSGNDLIYGNASDNFLQGGNGNDSLYGGAGSDIYVYTANSGADIISDASGALDKVSLRAYTLSQATFTAVDSDADTFVDYLHIEFSGGGTLDILDYFNNTSTSGKTASTEGTGLIESLVFSDDTDVTFAQVQGLLPS